MFSIILTDSAARVRFAVGSRSAHSLVGYCQSQLGQLREAIVNYKLALRLNPADKCSQELLEDAKRALKGCGGSVDDIKTPTREVTFFSISERGYMNILILGDAMLSLGHWPYFIPLY